MIERLTLTRADLGSGGGDILSYLNVVDLPSPVRPIYEVSVPST